MRVAIGVVARALGTGIVFVAALVLAVLLHIDAPAARRAIVERVNGVLAPLFVGKLTIERIGGVGLTQLDGIDARVDDADGKVVIHAAGVAGHVSTWALVRALARGEIDIEVHQVVLTRAEVNLDEDADGTLRIAKAFLPRAPSAPGPPGPSVRLSLPHVHLDHVAVRGRMTGVPSFDADLQDADASLSLVPAGTVRIDLARSRWVAHDFPGGRESHGDAEGHLIVPSPQGGMLELQVAARGNVGAVAASADATYDGGRIDAVADIPEATPEQARTIWAGWPMSEPLAVHAEAHGALPQIALKVHAAVGAAAVDVSGPVTLVPRLQASLHLEGKNIDARVLGTSEPSTDLAAIGDVSVATKPSGAIDAHVVLDVAAGRVGTAQIPSAALNGDLTRAPSPGGEITGTAKIVIHEPGAPTSVTVRLVPKKHTVVVAFEAAVDAPDLARIPRLRSLGAASGRVLAQADGTIDLGAGTIAARLAAATEGLEVAGVTVKAAHVEVRASGPVSAPSLNVTVAGEDLDVWRLQCSSVEASAKIGFVGGLTFQDVELSTRASDQEARVRARLVRVAGDDVRVEDAVVKGFGAPVEATVRLGPGSLYVRARTGELRLDRIARFLRVDRVSGGRVSFDVDAAVGGGVAEGKVDVEVTGASVAGFDDASAHVEATLQGRRAAGHVTASVADIGSIDVQSRSVEIGEGGPRSLASWRRAWGALDARAHIDLPKLLAHLPALTLPFKVAAGTVDLTGRLERDSPSDATPAVDVTATTTGLRLSGGSSVAPSAGASAAASSGPGGAAPAASGGASWVLDGIDPRIHVLVDGETGATALEAEIHDAKGTLAKVDATSSDVPFATLFAGDGSLAALRKTRVDARFEVPARGLESLPPVLGVSDLKGEVQAAADWHGTVDKPSIHATASLRRGLADPTVAALPVDVMASADYDGAHATATLQAVNRDKVVVDASGTADVKVGDLIDRRADATLPWTASARAKLDDLSLRSFPALSDRQVRGRVKGEVVLERLHDDARASATLAFESFAVGEVSTKDARVQATLDGKVFDGSLHVEQADGGYVNARALTGMHWGRALLPALDVSQPAQLGVVASKLRAALLLPFVSNVFNELDGHIDGDARITVDPAHMTAQPQGTISLKDGTFEVASLGGEFGDVSGKLELTPDGLIKLEDFVAHGLTGKVEAAATARLTGLAVYSASATVQIQRRDALPVVFDGVQLGTLDGHLDLAMTRAADKKGLEVTVKAPSLHMELPSTGTHDVQALGNLDNVKTGVQGSSGFVDVPLDYAVDLGPPGPPRAPIRIAIQLGNDVVVSRGTSLDVRLQGEPIVTIADDVRVKGQIRLIRGTLDVNGKPFEIQSGTISFDGDDPSNPQVVLTAMWTAHDESGTRVYADFTGPLKTGKVSLRSDPPLPGGQNEIRSLILFGTTDEASNQSNAFASAAPALGAAGSVAAQPINAALGGLNRVLDNIGLAGGITARLDTSQVNPRPEVELQIARDISVEVSWLIGVPVPGSNPDTTLATLNWRFLRNWALAATYGDAGTSILDLVWQHRY
jgi:translocation and assembly module TamB